MNVVQTHMASIRMSVTRACVSQETSLTSNTEMVGGRDKPSRYNAGVRYDFRLASPGMNPRMSAQSEVLAK